MVHIQYMTKQKIIYKPDDEIVVIIHNLILLEEIYIYVFATDYRDSTHNIL